MQKKIEKLRDVSTVSLNVKTKEEMEKEREKEDAESGGGVPGGDEESDEYDSEAEGEPTLEEMEEFATRKIGLKTATATAASSHPYTAADVGVQVWSLTNYAFLHPLFVTTKPGLSFFLQSLGGEVKAGDRFHRTQKPTNWTSTEVYLSRVLFVQ